MNEALRTEGLYHSPCLGFGSANDSKRNNVIPLAGRRSRRKSSLANNPLLAKRVLVVGADNTTFRIIEELSRGKALAYTAITSDEALDQLETTDYGLVVMVNHPPAVDALGAIRLFKFMHSRSTTRFLVLHDEPDWNMLVTVHEISVDASLKTPYKPIQLKKLLDSLLA